jgi:hypothetical protein
MVPKQPMAEETLIQRIRSLPPERVAQVEDFVDFLTVRDQDRPFTQAATRLSEEAFRAVWDNSDDAEYDRLWLRRRRPRPISVHRSNRLEKAPGRRCQRGRIEQRLILKKLGALQGDGR